MRNSKTEQTEFVKHPYEFVLKINDNIICQRFFNIYNYNKNVLDSVELKDLLDRIGGMNNLEGWEMGIIPSFLKSRSSEYLHYFDENPHLTFKSLSENIWEKEDVYTFEILIDGKVVGVTKFDGNSFPPKIRYKVNLKYKTNIWGDKMLDKNGEKIYLDILTDIQRDIKKTFQLKEYTKDYLGYSLKPQLS